MQLSILIRSLPGQFFSRCHPQVGLNFAEATAGYLLRRQCMTQLRILDDEYRLLVSGS